MKLLAALAEGVLLGLVGAGHVAVKGRRNVNSYLAHVLLDA
jgi:hypothetical protein